MLQRYDHYNLKYSQWIQLELVALGWISHHWQFINHSNLRIQLKWWMWSEVILGQFLHHFRDTLQYVRLNGLAESIHGLVLLLSRGGFDNWTTKNYSTNFIQLVSKRLHPIILLCNFPSSIVHNHVCWPWTHKFWISKSEVEFIRKLSVEHN